MSVLTRPALPPSPPLAPVVPGARVGCDVVTVSRIESLVARRPAARDALFTHTEQRDAIRDGVDLDSPEALRRLAARFAAKEAVVKMLARPRLSWTDVEVRTDADGAPHLWLLGAPAPIAISLSHDGDVAFACVAAAAEDVDHLIAVTRDGQPRTSDVTSTSAATRGVPDHTTRSH